jgi:hypothetical protein
MSRRIWQQKKLSNLSETVPFGKEVNFYLILMSGKGGVMN